MEKGTSPKAVMGNAMTLPLRKPEKETLLLGSSATPFVASERLCVRTCPEDDAAPSKMSQTGQTDGCKRGKEKEKSPG